MTATNGAVVAVDDAPPGPDPRAELPEWVDAIFGAATLTLRVCVLLADGREVRSAEVPGLLGLPARSVSNVKLILARLRKAGVVLVRLSITDTRHIYHCLNPHHPAAPLFKAIASEMATPAGRAT